MLALVDFVFYFSIYSYFHAISVSHSHFIQYVLKMLPNFVAYFSSTYIPNMKAFPFFITDKKRQFKLKFQFYRGMIVRIKQRQLSQLQFGGFFGGGYGSSRRWQE